MLEVPWTLRWCTGLHGTSDWEALIQGLWYAGEIIAKTFSNIIIICYSYIVGNYSLNATRGSISP